MKCPKCGYNSFEYLDNCKKCNSDLSGFKASHSIRAVVLPFRPLNPVAAPPEEGAPLPQTATAAETDDETFSWHAESAEPSPSGGGEFPLAFGQAEPEAEPFSFDLDLPVAEQEEPERELALEDLGGEEGLSLEETYAGAEQMKEEAAQPEESPFNDFSFDDLYKQESAQEEPQQPEEIPLETSATVDGPVAAGPAEFSLDDLMANDAAAPQEDTTVAAQPQDALAFDEFPFENTPFEQAAPDPQEALPVEQGTFGEEEEFDSMGLSPEEYESLFGEAPPKKKAAAN